MKAKIFAPLVLIAALVLADTAPVGAQPDGWNGRDVPGNIQPAGETGEMPGWLKKLIMTGVPLSAYALIKWLQEDQQKQSD